MLENKKINESPVLSVKDLSMALKNAIENQYTNIYVKGEVSGLKRHTSGHVYYALKDQDAVLDAVSWRGSQPASNSLPIPLNDGLEIIAFGRITTYPGRSKYQMVVESFEMAGQGSLLKLLEDRKLALLKEGLFNTKKPLPFIPQIIGIITSPTGAVIKDIIHRLSDRFPCRVIIYPVLVQGPGASEQIAKAITDFQTFNPRPDLLIIARGGGSLEDLWAFNEENVVRATAASLIPTISAIGHETDTTLIDYASDKRAPTPTAAAEMAVPVLKDLLYTVQTLDHRIQHGIKRYTDFFSMKINGFKIRHPLSLVEDRLQRLDEWEERLTMSIKRTLDKLEPTLLKLSEFLKPTIMRTLESRTLNYHMISEKLNSVSYERVLERGFCLAQNNDGSVITLSHEINDNSDFNLIFQDGIKKVKAS